MWLWPWRFRVWNGRDRILVWWNLDSMWDPGLRESNTSYEKLERV